MCRPRAVNFGYWIGLSAICSRDGRAARIVPSRPQARPNLKLLRARHEEGQSEFEEMWPSIDVGIALLDDLQ